MFQTLWQTCLQWVYEAGYSGVFTAMFLEGLGVPFPGDMVMAFYGFLAAEGHFSPLLIWLFATGGCYLGSLFAFYLGRHYGLSLLLKMGRFALISPSHIRRTEQLSRRYGVYVLILGRFLPGVRTLSSYFAAIGGMSWSRFLLFSLLGFLAWCFVWVGLGYSLGTYWHEVVTWLNRYLLWFTLLLLAALFMYAKLRRSV